MGSSYGIQFDLGWLKFSGNFSDPANIAGIEKEANRSIFTPGGCDESERRLI